MFAIINLSMQAQTAVPGMARFTDAGFGFSFWYPAAWKVTDERVADPTADGWFPDARIVKELKIGDIDDDQPTGIVLLEIVAPHGLTELGASESASPVGVDGRYFFDSKKREWMYAQLSVAPNGRPPSTYPAEFRQRTMGGFPILGGAVRHGGEVIVPLDASHFLAIRTMDVGGANNHLYLAATVEATDPDVGKRANAQVQEETIRREGIKLGAIGESIGYWYKDNEHVYDLAGEVMPGVNPKTFVLLPGCGQSTPFATDGVHVYWAGGVIPGADPKTFVGTGAFSGRDAQHTYDWSGGSLRISGATAQ